MLTLLEAAVACSSSGLGPVRLRAARVAMSAVAAARTTRVRAGGRVRSAAGQPSDSQSAADTGMATDTSMATCVGHQLSGGRSFRKQRTVNPLMASAGHRPSGRRSFRSSGRSIRRSLPRYSFLYPSSRPALRAAACGGRPRRQRRLDSQAPYLTTPAGYANFLSSPK
jgi:hypothetical protein